jgi:thiosulfate reductase/polysulfide reductase chain A
MSNVLFGWRLFPVVRDNTKCILLWGGGGPRYWDVFWKSAVKARQEKGAKIIVIDPRGIDTTTHADLWLQIRPGTDCALALAMINHIIERRLYNKAFVDAWCHGFSDLKQRAAQFPAERVAEIT